MLCTSCHQQLADAARFCPHCGTPAPGQTPDLPPGPPGPPPGFAPPPAAAPAPAPAPPAPEPGPAPRGHETHSRHRGLWLLVGCATALAVAVGGVSAFVLSRDDGDGAAAPTPDAITSEPERSWRWSPPGDGYVSDALVTREGHTLVAAETDDEFVVVALDEQGDEVWRQDLDYGYLSRASAHDDVFVIGYEEAGMAVFSTEDGGRLWESDDSWIQGFYPAGALLLSEDSLSLVDPETGDEVWEQRTTDTFAMSDDLILGVRGSRLTAFDLSSGDERWSTDTDLQLEEDSTLDVATGGDLVVVTSGDEYVGYDLSGDELFRDSTGSDWAWLYPTPRGVSLETSDDDGEVTEILFLEDEGEVDSLTIEEYEGSWSPEPIGPDHIFNSGTGDLLDADYQVVNRFGEESFVTATDPGVYVQRKGELSWLEDPSSSQEGWSIKLSQDEDSIPQLVFADRGIVVVDEYQVTRYE